MKIMFVCTGNTCRSPMAAVLAEDIFRKEDLNVDVDSAGVAVFSETPPSPHAIAAMERFGLSMPPRFSKQIIEEDISTADFIFTMTEGHKMILTKSFPYAEGKVFTLGEYTGGSADIVDPFGGDVEEYTTCADELKKILEKIALKLKKIQNRG